MMRATWPRTSASTWIFQLLGWCLVLFANAANAADTATALRMPSTILKLECGVYRASGRVELNAQNQFILQMRTGTVAPAELLLVDGEPGEKLSWVGLEVELEFYVPVPILGNAGHNVVYVRSLKAAKRFDDKSDPRLVKAEACGAEK